MNVEQSFNSRSEGKMNRGFRWSDLPPAQAGLAAALQRAFDVPADECERHFTDLLRKLG